MNIHTVLIWQWGRFGAGPRYAYELAQGLRAYGEYTALLSLSEQSEIFQNISRRSEIDLPISTYSSKTDFIKKSILLPAVLKKIDNFIAQARPDIAICAMVGPWDMFVTNRLVKLGVPVVTIVHDMSAHPGDKFGPLYMMQKRQVANSAGVITLSEHIAGRLRAAGLLETKVHATIAHIPFLFEDLAIPPPVMPGYPHRTPLRLVLAGRLQAYKGAELFWKALQQLPESDLEVRIVGEGSYISIEKFSQMSNVDLRRGWCSEEELIDHIDWSDVVVAPYIEASQSGITSIAQDRGRPVIATPVGGLPEQVRHEETGIITNDVTPEGLAQAIRRFIEDGNFYRYCALKTMDSRRQLSNWKSIGARINEVLGEVLS